MEEWRGCISHSLKRKGLDYETRKTGSEIIIKIGMIFQRVKRMKQANILQNFPWNFPKLKNPQNFEEAQMVFEERPPPPTIGPLPPSPSIDFCNKKENILSKQKEDQGHCYCLDVICPLKGSSAGSLLPKVVVLGGVTEPLRGVSLRGPWVPGGTNLRREGLSRSVSLPGNLLLKLEPAHPT